MLSLCRKQTDFFNYIIVNRWHFLSLAILIMSSLLTINQATAATSVAATPQAISGYDIHDVFLEGSGSSTIAYMLLSKLSGTGKFYTNPDGIKDYERDVYIAKVNANQFMLGDYLGRFNISSAVLSVETDLVRVFFNHKLAIATYAMDGKVVLLNKSDLRVSSHSVLFTNANWGWFPKFIGNTVEHFSYAGYYRMYNTTNKGSVTSNIMVDESAKSIVAHSQSVVPYDAALIWPGKDRTFAYNSKIVTALFAKLAALCSSTLENLGDAMFRDGTYVFGVLLQTKVPKVTLCGGILTGFGVRQNKVVQSLNDDVDIRAKIDIDAADTTYIGQTADIVVTAIYTPLNSKSSYNFMLDEYGVPLSQEESLVAFKPNVTLSKTQDISMYKGKFVGTGRLLVYLGFRLKKDGIVISNSTPIDILINP